MIEYHILNKEHLTNLIIDSSLGVRRSSGSAKAAASTGSTGSPLNMQVSNVDANVELVGGVKIQNLQK